MNVWNCFATDNPQSKPKQRQKQRKDRMNTKKNEEKKDRKRKTVAPYKIWKSICLYCHCIQRKMEFTNHLNEIMMTS